MIAGLLMGSYPDRGFVKQMGLQVPEELEEILNERLAEVRTKRGR